MVCFVYLDPGVFSAAGVADEVRLGDLTAMLRGFVQNCVLLDFDDYRWETSVRREIGTAEAVFDRSLVKKLLVHLKKRKRVVPWFRDDYAGRPELDLVSEQAAEAELDCIVTEKPCPRSPSCLVETTTLRAYQSSEFEQKRSDLAACGREFVGGEMDATGFLESNFRKAVKFAQQIDVCDAILGRKFADNYAYTLRRFLRFLADVLADPGKSTFTIHCQSSPRIPHLVTELAASRPSTLANLRINVVDYDASGGRCLPHDRYLATDQFGFEIGRGFDFLDRSSNRNRDVSINLKDPDVIREKLRPFGAFAGAPQPVAGGRSAAECPGEAT